MWTDNKTKYVQVTEQKAPTQESVKLLNEMQDAAMKNLVASVHVTSNTINGYVNFFKTPYSDMYVFTIKFNLNGKDYVVNKNLSGKNFYDSVIGKNTNVCNNKILSDKIVEFCKQELSKEFISKMLDFIEADSLKNVFSQLY